MTHLDSTSAALDQESKRGASPSSTLSLPANWQPSFDDSLPIKRRILLSEYTRALITIGPHAQICERTTITCRDAEAVCRAATEFGKAFSPIDLPKVTRLWGLRGAPSSYARTVTAEWLIQVAALFHVKDPLSPAGFGELLRQISDAALTRSGLSGWAKRAQQCYRRAYQSSLIAMITDCVANHSDFATIKAAGVIPYDFWYKPHGYLGKRNQPTRVARGLVIQWLAAASEALSAEVGRKLSLEKSADFLLIVREVGSGRFNSLPITKLGAPAKALLQVYITPRKAIADAVQHHGPLKHLAPLAIRPEIVHRGRLIHGTEIRRADARKDVATLLFRIGKSLAPPADPTAAMGFRRVLERYTSEAFRAVPLDASGRTCTYAFQSVYRWSRHRALQDVLTHDSRFAAIKAIGVTALDLPLASTGRGPKNAVPTSLARSLMGHAIQQSLAFLGYKEISDHAVAEAIRLLAAVDPRTHPVTAWGAPLRRLLRPFRYRILSACDAALSSEPPFSSMPSLDKLGFRISRSLRLNTELKTRIEARLQTSLTEAALTLSRFCASPGAECGATSGKADHPIKPVTSQAKPAPPAKVGLPRSTPNLLMFTSTSVVRDPSPAAVSQPVLAFDPLSAGYTIAHDPSTRAIAEIPIYRTVVDRIANCIRLNSPHLCAGDVAAIIAELKHRASSEISCLPTPSGKSPADVLVQCKDRSVSVAIWNNISMQLLEEAFRVPNRGVLYFAAQKRTHDGVIIFTANEDPLVQPPSEADGIGRFAYAWANQQGLELASISFAVRRDTRVMPWRLYLFSRPALVQKV